jgi:endonuclease III
MGERVMTREPPSLTYEPRVDRTDAELEAFALFSIAVAGKNADTTLRGVQRLLVRLATRWGPDTPFGLVRRARDAQTLAQDILESGVGCYNNRARAFVDLIDRNLDLRTCSVADLEQVWGIGPKTARFFVIFTREGVGNHAVLDVHILRFMRDVWGLDVPGTTPRSGPEYDGVERAFINLWEQHYRDKHPTIAEFDYAVWLEMRSKETEAA